MTVGDQACDQVDQKVDGTAMAGMLDLADVFELIGDGLDDGSFAQEELIRPIEQAVVHLFAQLRDQVQSLGDQQLLGQRLREIALVPKELADQACGQLGNGVSIIDITGCETKGYQLALVIDDQVQLEAIKPADRGFATSSAPIEDALLMDAGIMADCKRGRVNEADACAATQLRVQIGHQWHQQCRHQLDKARIADQSGKLAAQVTLDVLHVVGFERPIV
jgi:hypothetical protein